MPELIKGFSKLSKEGKMEWLINNYFQGKEDNIDFLKSYWHSDATVQQRHDEFIENTISNYYMPFGVAPNFLINGKMHCIPFAIEESSVVAAASKAASYWAARGGFHTQVLSTRKVGHVHFIWKTDVQRIRTFFYEVKAELLRGTDDLTENMRKRGGGIIDLQLVDKSHEEADYYQIEGVFDTKDAMGANFINSILERFAQLWKEKVAVSEHFNANEKESLRVIMCILSNYTPDCVVRAEVRCGIGELYNGWNDLTAEVFAEKFQQAVRIAEIEPYRAATHNKGIMNGIDAVVIATGNDFRAVEACAHSYAAKDGRYRSLTHCTVEDGIFRFWIEIPLALGTVGGITSLHPMVRFSLDLLGRPTAPELMGIVAASGLAQNFGAIASLVTTGIQKGHMKMHLMNIMNQLGCTEEEKPQIIEHFKNNTVSVSAVEQVMSEMRGRVKK